MNSPMIMQAAPCSAHLPPHRAMPMLPHPTTASSPHHFTPPPLSLHPKPSPYTTSTARSYAGDSPIVAAPVADMSLTKTDDAAAREGYLSFVMQGCEFLVRQTPEGALALSDTFVIDAATGASQRASTNGTDIPSEPRFYQAAEFAIDYPGNILQDKEEKKTVLKVYLATILSQEPYKLDIEQFFLMDGAKKSLERLVVQRVAPADTPENELRIRIRDRWVVIDTATSVPSPELVVQASVLGGTAMSRLEEEARARGEAAKQEARGDEDDVGDGVGGGRGGASAVEEYEDTSDVLYDDELLKDFLVEINDDEDSEEFDDYDQPATDY